MLEASVASSRSSASSKASGSSALEGDDAEHPLAGQDRDAEPGLGVGAADRDRARRPRCLGAASERGAAAARR